MNDKISAPLKECVECNAARPCLENFSLPAMNFVFAIRSRLTAKTISLQKFWRIGIDHRWTQNDQLRTLGIARPIVAWDANFAKEGSATFCCSPDRAG